MNGSESIEASEVKRERKYRVHENPIFAQLSKLKYFFQTIITGSTGLWSSTL